MERTNPTTNRNPETKMMRTPNSSSSMSDSARESSRSSKPLISLTQRSSTPRERRMRGAEFKNLRLLLLVCGLLVMVMPIMLPTAEGSAVPIRKKIQGFRIRRDIDPDCDFRDVPGTKLEPPYPSSEKEGFLGSLLGKARKRGHPVEQHPIESAGQQVPQQHGLPLAGWILAARSFGPPNGQFSRLVGAVLRHPKWLVAGGVVYQGQKALRSEAFRRAARFWYRIGPLVVHYKFTRWWLTTTGAPLEKRDAVYGKLHERYSPVAMNVALNLKGLYVKLAQVVSSRPDFVPLPYISLFVAAQDSLPQWPIEEVTELIDDSLRGLQPASSASLSYETVFEDIDAIALGSAAIGQCHRARIKSKYARELLLDGSSNSNEDNGGEDETLTPVDVAVKVMHPGAEERFKHDFSVFRTLCRVALTGWEPILDELHRQIMSEFDYRKEARSLAAVRDNMHHSPFRKSIRVPQPVRGLCSKELLVMELLDGDKLSDSLENELKDILGADRSKKLLDRKRLELVLGKDKLAALESVGEGDSKGEKATEGNVLAECGWGTKLKLLGLYRRAQRTIDMLVDVQGYQMLKDGVFQGDPHPGNILKLRGKTKSSGIASYYPGGSSLLGLIDYGQTKIITDEERLGLARVILALGERGEDDGGSDSSHTESVANAMRDLGFSTQNDDSRVLEQYAGLFFDSDEVGKRLYDCSTPQVYFKLLTKLDPLVNVPDVAVFAGRCGFILRGMGSILGKQIKTSERWSVYAKQALEEAEAKTE